MGEVYGAWDTRLDRRIAVKILPPQLTGSPHSLERFQREAKAVAALNHPNICSIYDVGEVPFPGNTLTGTSDGKHLAISRPTAAVTDIVLFKGAF
jgi:serine/threonine protein kinase